MRDLHALVSSKNYHKWIELHSLFPIMLFKWPSQRLGEKRQKLRGNWYHWKKYSLLLYSLRSSQDLISNSPYCLPYNFYNVSLDHLISDQLIIPYWIFFIILINCLRHIAYCIHFGIIREILPYSFLQELTH